jgi:hypothetical protein
VGPRAVLYGCRKSRPHRDWIPGPSSRNESVFRLSYPGYLGVDWRIWWIFKKLGLGGRIEFVCVGCQWWTVNSTAGNDPFHKRQ